MSWSLRFVIVLVSGCALGIAPRLVAAAEAAHPIVPAFERFHRAGEEPALGGQLLLGELSCTSCHQAEAAPLAQLHHKPGPNLEQVGSRVRPEYIAKFLADPHGTKPGTTMPDPFAGWAEKDKQTAVTALTHYLAQTGTVNDQQITPTAIGQGDVLYHRLGCVACHNAQKPNAPQLATSVPLGKLGEKYTLASLTAFLQDPAKARPASRMPALNLTADEARQLASYLLRDLKGLRIPANLKYTLYQGSYNTLPDFSQLKPKSQGETYGFDLSFLPITDHYALRFTGHFDVPRDGEYRFHIGSDDGSRLIIDNRTVVENDGIHPKNFVSATAQLKAGRHAVTVEYFEQAGEQELEVLIESATMGKQPLDHLLVTEKLPDAEEKPRFVVDPQLAQQGQAMFASLGCASCHQMKSGNQTVASTLVAPALAKLKTSGGCLQSEPVKGAPHFALSDVQRTALAEGITTLQQPLKALTPPEKIARTMKALNCVACHQRGELGGIEAEREPHFQTTQPEMGDEGRLPPPLTGVGAKLKASYLKQQLEQATKERPYMHTRMPRFAGFGFDELVEALTKSDPQPQLADVVHDIPERQFKQGGWTLVGAQGFSCIKCHTWGNTKATGIQSIDMHRMTTRLNEAWFEAYLLDPQSFRPGTRMPAAWPEGQVLLPKVLDGKAPTQIRALWAYLSDGKNARVPLGLGRDPIELFAISEPVIYRNFIEGSGPRTIAVGYPEKLNVAFDANQQRLAMIWQGSFIDASMHWVDRGSGFQSPLGDHLIELPAGVPFATLTDEKVAWPKQPAKELGYQFQGYRLDKQRRPVFRYKFGAIEVTDAMVPSPLQDKSRGVLERTLTFTSNTASPEVIYFRAAVEDAIVAGEDGTFSMKEPWQLKITGGEKPILRTSEGKTELLVPIRFENGKATIAQKFTW